MTVATPLGDHAGDDRRLGIDEDNPWPGLAAFDETAQRFFNGRLRETLELRRLVLDAPLTVVFGASGLGKTSLLQAGLFPLLRKDGVLPVYVRLDVRDRTAPLIDQVGATVVRQLQSQHVEGPPFREDESLWEWLHRDALDLWGRRNQLLTPLLVFDQFEEVFTLGDENAEAIARLRVDLADLIENRIPARVADGMRMNEAEESALALSSHRYKVLVSFREDFLPAVESWKPDLPSLMRNRLRLLPMSGEQAFEAVHGTAPHLVDESIAREVVQFVAAAQRDSSTPGALRSVDRSADLPVEPALLSLVCHGLNERRKAQGKRAFDSELLRGTGHSIIADYYQNAVGDLPERVGQFVEHELITERGFRKPCDLDDAQTIHGVTREEIRVLVDRRLLRIEPHRGSERVELTHDLLTPVVREHRDRQRQAARLRRHRKRLGALAALGAAAVTIALALLVLYTNARRAADLAQRRLAVVAFREATVRVSQGDDAGALAFLARALRLDPTHAGVRALAADVLLNRSWPTAELPAQREVANVALSPDGEQLVTASVDTNAAELGNGPIAGAAEVWDLRTGQRVGEPLVREGVVTAEWSPDGTQIATALVDAPVRFWEPKSRKAIGLPLNHRAPVLQVKWSADRSRLATLTVDGAAQIWNARTWEPVGEPLLTPQQVKDLAWSPDATRLATASQDGYVRLWDAATGRMLHALKHDESDVRLVAWSPDSTKVASSLDEVVRVWDAGTALPIGKPLVHDDDVVELVWSADGESILTASKDNMARRWIVRALTSTNWGLEASVHKYPHTDEVDSVALSPDGTLVLTGSDDHIAQMWTATNPEPVRAPYRHLDNVRRAIWNRDGTRVITVERAAAVKVWSTWTGRMAGPRLWLDGQVQELAWSPDGTRILTGTVRGVVGVWDARTGEPIGSPVKHSNSVSAVAWSPDGSRILTAAWGSEARISNARTGELIAEMRHKGIFRSVAWSPDGTRVITGSSDKTAQVWHAQTGRAIGPPLRHGDEVTTASWSPNGKQILTGSSDHTAQIWNGETGEKAGPPLRHDDAIRSASWSPDSTRVLSGSNDRTARIWDARTGRPVGVVMQHGADVITAAWSPDGLRVATISNDEAARIWSAETGQAIGAASRQVSGPKVLQWSPDGTRVLVGGTQGAQVLDARTGLPVSMRLEHRPKASIDSAAWSPDGTRVVTGSFDGTATLWDVPLVSVAGADRVAEVAELTGGFRVNDDDALISVGDWQVRTARLRAVRDELSSDAATHMSSKLLKWFLADPYSRSVSPVSSLSIDAYVTRALARGSQGRAEVQRNFPGHLALRASSTAGGSTSASPR